MAFTSSNMPTLTIATWVAAGGTTFWSAGGFVANTVNVALYGNTGVTTPTARDDTPLTRNAYNGTSGQWVVANESTASTSGYTAGGSALPATKAITVGTGTVSATTTTQTLAWTIVGTLSATFGCLVYDNTITNKYAYCWNYFGGSNTVTGGTFTITWFGAGSPYQLYTITVT